MGGFGAMAGMISSLKNNLRRKENEHFSKDGQAKVSTPLKFKEVSENEKNEIVQRILIKRKKDFRLRLLIGLILIVTIILVILYI